VLGGERIETATIADAHEVLGPFGVTREAITPAYGLAEGTLAVTMKNFGEEAGSVWIDRERAYGGEVVPLSPADPGATSMTSCGPPMPGVSVRTQGSDLGRIRVRSKSLASGYLDEPEITAESFVDGEFHTGDLGFLHDGELYVLGRTDDVLVIAGHNIHARDIEGEIERHDGIRPGCSALIDCGEAGRSRVVLIAEPTAGDAPLDRIADDLAELAFRSAGLRVSECIFVRPGNLPKTPSGKIQRFLCRQLIEDGDGEATLERVPT
jgi:acyl-CoA synthetase (AMP-forming)/AMP-acid ligase II